MDNFGCFLMNGGILGQFGRSFLGGRGILEFWENHFFESLRSSNIMVSLKISTPTPAPDHQVIEVWGGLETNRQREIKKDTSNINNYLLDSSSCIMAMPRY